MKVNQTIKSALLKTANSRLLSPRQGFPKENQFNNEIIMCVVPNSIQCL